MNRILVAIFSAQQAASEGQRALEDLHASGELTVYATAIVAHDAGGTARMQQVPDAGPAGRAISVLARSLTGLAAAPVPATPGLRARRLAGLVSALAGVGIDADFVEEVADALTPGKAAVLAEVQETRVTPVNLRLGNLGALVYRRPRAEVAEDQLARESATLGTELKSLEEELRHTGAENRAALQNEIEDLRQRLEWLQEQTEARQLQAGSELAGKIAALHDQMRQAANRQAARTELHIAEVEADYAARSAKLEQALKRMAEALAEDRVREGC